MLALLCLQASLDDIIKRSWNLNNFVEVRICIRICLLAGVLYVCSTATEGRLHQGSVRRSFSEGYHNFVSPHPKVFYLIQIE